MASVIHDVSQPIRGQSINLNHPLAKGLVGYWPMLEGTGEILPDYSGRGTIGTFEGTLNSGGWNQTDIGSTLRGSGNDQWVHCQILPDLSQVSYCMWIRGTDATGIFLSSPGQLSGARIAVYPSSGVLYGRFDDGELKTIIGATNITDGRLHHVAMTYKAGGFGRIYVDGKLDAAPYPASGPLTVGTDYGMLLFAFSTSYTSGNNAFAGDIQNITQHNRELSPNEIQQLHSDPWCLFHRDIYIPADEPTYDISGTNAYGTSGIDFTWTVT